MPVMTIQQIQGLWNGNDENLWRSLENEGYMDQVGQDRTILEDRINNLNKSEVLGGTPDVFYKFLREYFEWKYTQANLRATTLRRLENMNSTEKRIVLGCFRALDEVLSDETESYNYIRDSLTIAMMIPGLGVAGASGLLSVLFPDKFGTVDQFVVNNLKEIGVDTQVVHPENLSVDDAIRLERIMIDKARELNSVFTQKDWTPRKIDKVLWCIRVEKH
ncbi:hypothetical protein SAMN02910456_02033 [Ruminococcaceae bacterium YRB3002]|nr:hypothetical protein SAMN02910456_02033 [Ruminococcaceae bacterium YRB3002]